MRLCRTFEEKLRGDVFNLFTCFERFVIYMWSVTINRKVVLWRKASDKNVANFIDKLVINLVFSETKDVLDTVMFCSLKVFQKMNTL